MQEILGEAKIILRVDEGLTDGVFIGHGGEGWHFGYHAVAGELAVLGVVHVQRIMIERGKRSGCAQQYGHGVAGAGKAAIQKMQLFMRHGVQRYAAFKGSFFLCVG
mgnify:CR=1 FL=1